MRRKDKEVSDQSAIVGIIEAATVCRLAMVDGDTPYVVPLCFGYQDQVLYFHSALKGRKIDLLRENPNVCFEFDAIAEPIASDAPCSWGMKYQSVIGFGKAVFIDNPDEKRNALGIIMAQYTDRSFAFPEDKLQATAVFKVAIARMRAKQAGF